MIFISKWIVEQSAQPLWVFTCEVLTIFLTVVSALHTFCIFIFNRYLMSTFLPLKGLAKFNHPLKHDKVIIVLLIMT